MSTIRLDPDKCDEQTWRDGKVVWQPYFECGGEEYWTRGRLNAVCQRATELAGFIIDWSYAAGRPFVRTLGDSEEARKAIGLACMEERSRKEKPCQ